MYYVHFKNDGSGIWTHTMVHFEQAPGIQYDRCFEVETASQTEANAVSEAVAALIAHGVRPEARQMRSSVRVREIAPFA